MSTDSPITPPADPSVWILNSIELALVTVTDYEVDEETTTPTIKHNPQEVTGNMMKKFNQNESCIESRVMYRSVQT